MSFDRSMRNALAALLLVAALFVAMNQVVASAPLADWWLPIALFVVGAGLALAPQMRRAQPSEEEEAPAPASRVHTYEIAAPKMPLLPFDVSAEAEDGDDDLTRINGIGRKSADALKAAGIDTFRKLANSTEDALHDAIDSAGVRLVGDVATWAQQAAFAARGDWDGLSEFNAERHAATGA